MSNTASGLQKITYKEVRTKVKFPGWTLLKRTPLRLGLKTEDMLAIPLCILWGLALMAWSYGGVDLFGGTGTGSPFSFLWGAPALLSKYLLGS
jgi:hypothetical protein